MVGIVVLLGAFAALADARLRGLAWRSFELASASSVLATLVGLPIALLLARTDVPGRRAATGLLIVLASAPLFFHASAWQAALAGQGWISTLMGTTSLLSGLPAAIGIHAAAATPWFVLLFGWSLRHVEAELEDETLLNATPIVVLFKVTLVRAAPTLAAATLWNAIVAAGDMTVTDLFQIRTFAEELYTELALGDDRAQPLLANIASWIFSAALCLLMLAALRLAFPRRHEAASRGVRRFALGSWRAPAAALLAAELLALGGVPIGGLIYKAGVVIERQGNLWSRAWSLAKAARMTAESPAHFAGEIGASLAIALVAATIAWLLAATLAYFSLVIKTKSWLVDLLLAIGLALPGPSVAWLIIALLNVPDSAWRLWLFDDTIAAPLLAQVVRAFPIATLVLQQALRSTPEELWQSARSDGASRLGVLRGVALPLVRPAALLAGLAALVFAFGELSASISLVPPGLTTLPIRLFTLLHYGVDDQVAAASLSVLLMFALLAAACVWMFRRDRFDPWI